MSHLFRTLFFSILILGLAGGAGFTLWHFRPKAEEKTLEELVTPVEIAVAKPIDHAVSLSSQGVLEARTLTKAASEVSGKVIQVAPGFEVGGRFRAGEELLRIDPADYEANLAQAKASLADASLQVEMEEAKAAQSIRDWKKLGRATEPSALVKREPQLTSARARVTAAKAAVEKAERDLERTRLLAPYDGRVLRTHTDVASFVPMGGALAEFYESRSLEVRLPISLADLSFLSETVTGSNVTLSTATDGPWTATIVRRDAEIDRRSRSLHLIASLDPDEVDDDPLLVPGLFVRAAIEGRTLQGVFAVPRKAFQGESDIVVVTAESTLTKRSVTVVRHDADTAYVREGLKAGERVCVSFLPTFIEGMRVRVVSENPQDLTSN